MSSPVRQRPEQRPSNNSTAHLRHTLLNCSSSLLRLPDPVKSGNSWLLRVPRCRSRKIRSPSPRPAPYCSCFCPLRFSRCGIPAEGMSVGFQEIEEFRMEKELFPTCSDFTQYAYRRKFLEIRRCSLPLGNVRSHQVLYAGVRLNEHEFDQFAAVNLRQLFAHVVGSMIDELTNGGDLLKSFFGHCRLRPGLAFSFSSCW